MSTANTPASAEDGAVLLERIGGVALLTLSRPTALNAMTWTMYRQLAAHLDELAASPTARVIVIQGAGHRAFAAGTDIGQFQGFTGADGIAYEERMEQVISRLAHFPQPTIAAIEGYAVGGGLVMATACDLRYATPTARFGAPIARTLGNCLSLQNCQRLVEAFGAMRTKDMLFTGRLLSADEALQAGFLTTIFDEAQLLPRVLAIAAEIAENAPLTIWATKEALRRLREADAARLTAIPFADVVTRVYGSQDFQEGVRAHLEKRRPLWHGQ